MPWKYSQSTGQLTHNGRHVCSGYSGKPGYKNNPYTQWSAHRGVIPVGVYSISPATRQRGMGFVLNLWPNGHSAYGRTDFEFHGDSIDRPGEASKGCIIIEKRYRIQIHNDVKFSNDRTLLVVP